MENTSPTHLIVAAAAGRVGLERLARTAKIGDRCLLVGNHRDAEFLRSEGCLARIERLSCAVPRWYLRVRLRRSNQQSPLFAWDEAAADLAPKAEQVNMLEAAPCTVQTRTAQERSAKRRALGVRDDEQLIGLLCSNPERADVFNAALILSFPLANGKRVRLLVHPAMSRLAHTTRHFTRMEAQRMFVQSDIIERPWECAPLLDAAMLDEDGASTGGRAAAGGRLHPLAIWKSLEPSAPSALPALWTLAHAVPTLVHESIALPDAWSDRVYRFGGDRMHAVRALEAALEKRDCCVAVERA